MLIEFAIFIATLLGTVILTDTLHTVHIRYERSKKKLKRKKLNKEVYHVRRRR